uniref:Protein kinase domain-containing protein n=1 Tax=Ditylum brightwellii TaxID=49249 RepID=A0A7S4R2Z3_9STRA
MSEKDASSNSWTSSFSSSSSSSSSSSAPLQRHGHQAPSPSTIPMELANHKSLSWGLSSKHLDKNKQTTVPRHETDFTTIRVLGRGAFGITKLVRNTIDSRLYAMKIVKIDTHGNNNKTQRREKKEEEEQKEYYERVLREAKVLSGLRSDNVVRYYNAWVEQVELRDEEEDCNEEEYSSFTLHHNSSQEQTTAISDPTCHLCKESYKDWEVSFEQWGLIDAVLQPLDLCIDCYKQSIPVPSVQLSDIRIVHTNQHNHQPPIYHSCLFLIMEYCESTLMDAVRHVTPATTTPAGMNQSNLAYHDNLAVWSLFGQCVQGLAYLHSKGVIHRDVKPQNIFVHDSVVKIGDLGLATYASTKPTDDTNNHHNHEEEETTTTTTTPYNSTNVGTFWYTAPEVSTGRYNEKCDIYSLGIVLFELFSSFTTGMERISVLQYLRTNNKPPDEWSSSNSIYVASLICQMIKCNPKERPSCKEIYVQLVNWGLVAPFKSAQEQQEEQEQWQYQARGGVTAINHKTPDNVTKEQMNNEQQLSLLATVTNLQVQVKDLQEKLEEKDDEILYLRSLLDEHGIKMENTNVKKLTRD